MHPKIHFLFGLIFIGVLYTVFPKIGLFNLAIILFSSILIDGDHYIYYILKKRDFSLIRAYKWFSDGVHKTCKLPFKERKKIYTGFYFLHGIEWLIILFLLGKFVLPIFTFVLIGFSFHMLLDIPSEIAVKGTCHKLSLFYNYSQWKKLEKN